MNLVLGECFLAVLFDFVAQASVHGICEDIARDYAFSESLVIPYRDPTRL